MSDFTYIRQAPQIQRHEIARMQQFVLDLENHVDTIHQKLTLIARTMSSEEDRLRYTTMLLDFNKTIDSLNEHREKLNEMLSMADTNFGKTIPEQCRREIYHLYHSGRYSQVELANQYDISQSAVSKIVNGSMP